MWERCVEESRLSQEDHDLIKKTLVRHPPGSPIVLGTLEDALGRSPGCPALWMARAGVHHAEGRAEEALADLKKAAETGKDWPEVQRAFAVALHNDGGEGAGEVLEHAIELNPHDPLLKIYNASEKPPSERSELLLAAVDAHPADLDVALAAVDALAEAGRPMEAVALAHERNSHLGAPELAQRIASLEAPFEFVEEERIRRPGEFRTLEDGTTEVIVYSPARARQELENRLTALGFTERKEIDGGVRYRSVKPIQPWVEIYDDGRVVVQESGFVKPPADTVSDGSSMIPVISKRKLAKKRAKLMENIWYEVTVWRQAHIRMNFQEQLGEHLPDLLTGVWERGEPMFGEGALETPAERRAALLDYWATRACSDDGDAAREVVATFLARVVQESDQPASAEEIAAAEAKCSCEGRTLDLDAKGAGGVE